MKKCKSCMVNKEFTNFCKNKNTKDGFACYCRPCFSKIKKINDPKYAKSEKGKIGRYKANKKHRSKPEVRHRILQIRRAKISRELKQKMYKKLFDPLYKLKCLVRGRLYTFLKNKGLKKKYKLHEYLGCTSLDLKNFIENKFQEGMTWENHGEWHLDHVIPLARAKTEEEIYQLCHYTNLQPLWALDNLKKGYR